MGLHARHGLEGQAQLALTLALASQPDFLVLDEPLARLDPLARHEFMALLMTAVAELGLSVLFSSHVVSELERVASFLVILTAGRVQIEGEISDLAAEHRVFTGTIEGYERFVQHLPVLHMTRAGRQVHLLVRVTSETATPDGWESAPAALEDIVLGYLRDPEALQTDKPSSFDLQAFSG